MNNEKMNNKYIDSKLYGSINILLIDEDHISRKMIEKSLNKLPNSSYRLEISKINREGIAKAISEHIDCIIINHDNSSDGCIFLLEKLRDHNFLDVMPVIFFTSSDDQLTLARILKAGANDYLLKEKINTATLKKSIDSVISDARMRAELNTKNSIIEKTTQHLQNKTNELESFYHNVSHELKTPLTSIREFSSMLLDEVAGPLNKSQKEYARICIDSCDRAANYINSLLDLIRCDAGSLKIEPSKVLVKSIVDDAVSLVKQTLPKNSVKIKYSIRTKKEFIHADRDKILQVLINLINNAVKNSNDGSVVSISVRDAMPTRDEVIIKVKDTGNGIHPNKLDHIFERNFQLENLEPGTYEPIEMGLYLSQKIVERHHGEIFVESSLGAGSTFAITLPCINTKIGMMN
ncbi:MAG: signal transduction histidine kinase [Enterobacterales bacterium]|jgi:signal transduction histidine kinase